MFEMLSTKNADTIADVLSGSGSQGRARKAVLQFRRNPTGENETDALALLNGLEQNIQKELRAKTKLRH